MPQPFEKALTQIAYVISNVAGIHQAPERPGETQNDYPFAAIYLTTGNLGLGAIGTRKSLYNIAIDVLTARLDLARDLEILNPFLDTVVDALVAEVSDDGGKFENTISTFDEITMQFIPRVDYAGVQMIGYRFVMSNVKILHDS